MKQILSDVNVITTLCERVRYETIHSFIHSFTRSIIFTQSFIHEQIYSFILSLVFIE